MKAVDLFCGCGGFSLGAHQAGLETSAAFDIDPILTSSFKKNFPKTQLKLADLSVVSGAEVEAEVGGRVDVLFGGPPCQGFSDIGRRDVGDPRRELLGHFFRLVAETRPAFFIMENVRGLAYADARPVLDRGLELLPSCYQVLSPTIFDASEYGAATKRPRLFVIGYDRERCDPTDINEFASLRKPAATVKQAISDLQSSKLIGTVDGFEVWKSLHGGRRSEYAVALARDDREFTCHRITRHTPEVIERFSRVKQGGTDSIGRHPRLAWNAQCPTLRAGTGSDRGSYQSVRPIHPTENRVITAREAARLQGFPDRHLFHPTTWHSFRMIGNSVSPFISRALFSVMIKKVADQLSFGEAAE